MLGKPFYSIEPFAGILYGWLDTYVLSYYSHHLLLTPSRNHSLQSIAVREKIYIIIQCSSV